MCLGSTWCNHLEKHADCKSAPMFSLTWGSTFLKREQRTWCGTRHVSAIRQHNCSIHLSLLLKGKIPGWWRNHRTYCREQIYQISTCENVIQINWLEWKKKYVIRKTLHLPFYGLYIVPQPVDGTSAFGLQPSLQEFSSTSLLLRNPLRSTRMRH